MREYLPNTRVQNATYLKSLQNTTEMLRLVHNIFAKFAFGMVHLQITWFFYLKEYDYIASVSSDDCCQCLLMLLLSNPSTSCTHNAPT